MALVLTIVSPEAVEKSGAVVAGGAKKAEFDGLVRRYQKHAYNVAYRMTGNHADAEDLTQEAFLRAFRFFWQLSP